MVADALLVLTFGGPESAEDVMPFLRRVTAGRGVPDERLAAVAGQYDAVGGISPLNDHSRALVTAVEAELSSREDHRPVYWATRNTSPFVGPVVAQMAADGVREATVFVPSAFSSYSGCRQYLEDLARAAQACGPSAPKLSKIPPFFNNPGFLSPLVDAAAAARKRLDGDSVLLCTAHSLPAEMAAHCDYEAELSWVVMSLAAGAGFTRAELAYQSRSGRPGDPWLGPAAGEVVERLAEEGVEAVVIAPIGFVHDHMEVVYDLDAVVVPQAESLGLRIERIRTPGHDPRFASMVVDLFQAFDSREVSDETCCGPGCCASR